MNIKENFTYHEIQTQPEAWAGALKVLHAEKNNVLALDRHERFDQVLFTGCGSTYYLSLAAAALYTDLTGKIARALPASELWLYPRSAYPAEGRTLLVAVSRSGETTETLRACTAFLEGGRGDLVTLSCYPERDFAGMGKLNLVFPSAQEDSIAQTRAFSTLYLGTIALAALWSGREDLFDELDRLPEVCSRLLKKVAPLARELGADPRFDRFYFLGSGLRYGLAAELSLKMKEMTLSHSEPFHFMEFRHGPKSMISSSALVVGLRSEQRKPYENAVLDEMAALGAEILSIGEQDARVTFDSGVDEAIRNVLYLPVGQMLGFEHAVAKGLNPDLPHNLDAVVKL